MERKVFHDACCEGKPTIHIKMRFCYCDSHFGFLLFLCVHWMKCCVKLQLRWWAVSYDLIKNMKYWVLLGWDECRGLLSTQNEATRSMFIIA